MAQDTWHPGTTMDQVTELMAEGAEREASSGVTVRGYDGLVGGGAGYFLLEADESRSGSTTTSSRPWASSPGTSAR